MTDETIFAVALEKADPVERSAYLDLVCGDDAALRKRIEGLLAAHLRAVGFLERPVVARPEPDATETRAYRSPAAAAADGDTHTQGEGGDDDRADALAFLAPSGRPDSLGRIGHYEVLEVLGKGGFGIVLRAFDEVLQRVVAVKMLAPSMAATSPARKRFLREARSAAQVHHENVIQIHATEENPLPYLVMEFIPGETLQQRLDRTGPLDVPEVLRIGRQIAEGLAAAHATGLIHRDIKPSNILLHSGPGQQVKITDFGLARAADDASLTRSGTVAGTPMYMAPEQARGETLDHRADLFSLGSVLYSLLTGRPPFRAETTLAVLKRVVEEDPRPIREIIPEVPEWLCRIIKKLHAKDPADRYQSAREVADVLADCETQLKTNGALRDFSHIPGGKPPRRRWHLKRLARILGILLGIPVLYLALKADDNALHLLRYLQNQNELVVEPMDGLIAFTIYKDGQPVTDRIDATTRQTIPLPPGKYRLEPILVPGGAVKTWQVKNYHPWGPPSAALGGWGANGVEFEITRGRRVEIRPEMRVEPRQSPDDKTRLQGRWRIVGAERNGKPLPIAELKEMDWIEFTGDKQKMYWAGQVWPGTFTINPAAEPREMDFAGALYGSFRIIYRFDGDRLVMAQAGPKQPRPTRFTTTPDTKFTVASYVRDPSPPPNGGWVQLFNGKDLTGWRENPSWTVRDGVLQSVPGSQRGLASQRTDFANFHLLVEARINDHGNSGIFFRMGPAWQTDTYEAQIALDRDPIRTGSLWNLGAAKAVREKLIKPDEWFTMEVIAIDNDITVKVDGKVTTHWIDPNRTYMKGTIAFQQYTRDTVIQFRKIEIKELPADKSEGPSEAPNPAVVQALRDAAAAKERGRDSVKVRFDEGLANKLELVAAEVERIEARIRVVQAEGDKSAVVKLLEELVAQRQAARDVVAVQVMVGTVRHDELDKADALVAEAKARLAQVGGGAPPDVAPDPRPKR